MNKNKSTERSIFFLLEKTSKIIREKIGEYLVINEVNISSTQWFCIHCIHINPGIKQKDLALELSREEASISRIIKKLLIKNIIYRKKNNTDKKTQNLYLSPEGIELIKNHQTQILSIYNQSFSGIYEREMNLVYEILKRISPS